MPFIINHIDTLATIASVTLKVLKFAATVAHYIALAIGAVLILTGYWLVTAHQHFTGKTQTVADVTEAVHGPVLAEYGESAMLTPEAYMAGVLSTYSLPKTQNWVLEDMAVAIAVTKPGRNRRAKKAPLVAA
jgi:hypothetical protein